MTPYVRRRMLKRFHTKITEPAQNFRTSGVHDAFFILLYFRLISKRKAYANKKT